MRRPSWFGTERGRKILFELKDCDRIGEAHDFARTHHGDYICYFCHFHITAQERSKLPPGEMMKI